MSRKNAPVSLFSPNFLVILSTRRANCKDELCLGLNPNYSSRSSPRSVITCKILVNMIFSNSLPFVSKRLMGPLDYGSAGSLPGLRIEVTRACLHKDGK